MLPKTDNTGNNKYHKLGAVEDTTPLLVEPRLVSVRHEGGNEKSLFDRVMEQIEILSIDNDNLTKVQQRVDAINGIASEFETITEDTPDEDLELIIAGIRHGLCDTSEKVRLRALDALSELMQNEEGFWATQIEWKGLGQLIKHWDAGETQDLLTMDENLKVSDLLQLKKLKPEVKSINFVKLGFSKNPTLKELKCGGLSGDLHFAQGRSKDAAQKVKSITDFIRQKGLELQKTSPQIT